MPGAFCFMAPRFTITADRARVLAFVRTHVPLALVENMTALGLERDGELIAGVIYEGFNGHNIWMHCAIPGRLTREFVNACFHYPFVQLGCKRVSGYVEASNIKARLFDEHLGFKPEARLRGAASDGGDVILYAMTKEGCRYVAQD